MTAGVAASMPPPAIIRPATVDDLDRVMELLWAVAAEGRWIGPEVPFDRESRRARLADLVAGGEGSLLVADVGRAAAGADVVGYISVGVTSYGVAEIGMLLAQGWRCRGLGSALLDAGLVRAVDAGAHKGALEVWPHNEPALDLYRKAGFVEEGRKQRHYRRANGEVWDAILMGRPLLTEPPTSANPR